MTGMGSDDYRTLNGPVQKIDVTTKQVRPLYNSLYPQMPEDQHEIHICDSNPRHCDRLHTSSSVYTAERDCGSFLETKPDDKFLDPYNHI